MQVKIPHPHVRKSKLLLGKAGVINVLEDDSPPPPSENNEKDPYNISNDEYYAAKATEAAIKGAVARRPCSFFFLCGPTGTFGRWLGQVRLG